MPKRALSSTDNSVLPSRSSRRPHRQRAVTGPLHQLPVELLALSSSFLPLRDVLLAVGVTCHGIADRLTPAYLSDASLLITRSRSAWSLLLPSDRSRTLLAGIPALYLRTAVYAENGADLLPVNLPPLLSLFSSLTFLYLEGDADERDDTDTGCITVDLSALSSLLALTHLRLRHFQDMTICSPASLLPCSHCPGSRLSTLLTAGWC
jgi:hypothetical protein